MVSYFLQVHNTHYRKIRVLLRSELAGRSDQTVQVHPETLRALRIGIRHAFMLLAGVLPLPRLAKDKADTLALFELKLRCDCIAKEPSPVEGFGLPLDLRAGAVSVARTDRAYWITRPIS